MLARLSASKCVAVILLLAATAGTVSQPMQRAAGISSERLASGTVRLIGPWKFHVGDDPAWASPYFDDSGWTTISGDRPWGQQGHAGYTGFAWYRIRLRISGPQDTPEQLFLLVPHVHDVYEIFWNGRLAGAGGKMPPWPVWKLSQQPQIFRMGNQREGFLAFRIWKAPLFSDDSGELGGFDVAPVLGDAEGIDGTKSSINYQWLRSRQLEFAEQLIYGLVALLAFLVWWRNREKWLLLWMSAYSLTPLLGVLLLDAHLALPYAVAMGLTQPVNCCHDVSLWLLLLWLLHLNEDRAMSRIVTVFAIFSLAITSLDGLLLPMAWNVRWLAWVQGIDGAITTASTIIQLIPLVLVSIAIRRRSRLGRASWILAAIVFVDGMFVAVQQALKQGQRFTGWTIGNELANPIFSIADNDLSTGMILRGLMLVAVVTAVYIHYRDERRSEMLLEDEFSHARRLQRMLIPEDRYTTPGFLVSSSYRPALAVGGDFFQLIPSQSDANGSALLVLGDVSGHGLKAALSVSYVMGVMRVLAELFPEPGPLLTEMNCRLCGRMENGFTTCIAVRVDKRGVCTLSSAGHPPPFLNWRPLDVPGALPLGLDTTARYEQTTVQLDSGDHLALYTDGLLEARNKAGELYGFERLQKLFAANPTAPDAAEEAIRFGQDDDVTVVTLTYVGEQQPTPEVKRCRLDFAHR